MNKSYRTVWNATTGTWTAAAETARMRTKSKSNTTMRSSVTAAVAVMAGVGGGSMANDAMAQAANGGGSLSLCAPTGSGYYGTTFGGGNTVGTRTTGACGTAISNFRLSEGHVRSFQLYNHSNVNGGGVGQASAATEAGISGTVDGHLFLLGGSGVHLRGPVDVDSNFNMTNHRINNLAAGTAGTDAVNVNQLNAAIAAAGTVNPYVVTNTGTYAAATAARAGSSATAIGANASATGTSAVALGGNTVANNQNATAIGTLSRATGSESVAVGTSANAAGANASAFGQAAAAQAVNTTSVGSRSTATADGATSLGFSASAVGANAIAVGRGASTSGTYGSAIGYSANATTNAVAIGVLANATSASSVALGERASATGTTATALGRGALASGTNSVALGANSVGDRNNAVSVGSTSQQRQIVNVAAGTQNTDAVNLGQMNTALSTKVDNTYIKIDTRNGTAAAQAGSGAVAIGTNTSASGTYATAFGNSARANGDNSTALGFQASSAGGAAVAVGNGANASGSHGVALGVNAVASHTDSVALGALSATDRNNSVSVGSSTLRRQITNVAAGTQETDAVNVGQLNAAIAAGSNPYVAVRGSIAARASGTQSIAIGDGAIANATDINGGQTNIAIGAKAYTSGGFGQLALGEGASTTNTNAGGAIAIGRGARTTQRGVALGDGASVTAQYGVALGDTSIADRANSVSVGSATLQRQITNVAAGTQDTDAVNVSQLKGSGLIGDDGKSIAAVTYDRNADGTPNYGTVTLGNGAGPTQIKNVADATDDHDALNLGQLKDAGLVGDDGKGNLTSMAVTYDGAARDKVTLAGADGTTLSNVKAGVANMDAVNVGQLKDSGLIGDDGKSIAAVTYDRNADGTPNYGTVTLGNGAGPTQIKNVADATDDHDALNLGQLKDAGLVGDDGKGNLTSMAVTYDGAAKDSITLGGVGATTPVAIHNVKDGELSATSKDAVNGSQLFATNTRVGNLEDSLKDGGVIDPVTGESLAVVYDGNAKDTVTLKGADGTTLSNVKAGVADMDAVNVSQLKGSGLIGDDGKAIAAVTYDRLADGTPNYGSVTLGNGAGPTQIKNVADATDDHDAINYNQLKQYVADNSGGSGNPLAVGYDDDTKARVTLQGGADGTTITNVKAGAVTATSTDAINGAQLHGTAQSMADSLGGGATVGADGKVTNPTYSLADPADASQSKSYNNVGDALSNLDGRTTTNTQNITVINKQLADSGLVDPVTGQSITAVTYDRNADGTPNLGSVTLGGAGATTPVALKNVADGVDRHDAINVGQLQDAGLVAPVDPANPGAGLTSLAVAYDGVAKDTVTLKGADGTTLSNVKAGVADMDAVNVSQLKGSGLIGDDGKAIAAVTYDRNADGTPNYGSVTLGNGAGPTQLKNVADATDDGDALNLGQLKDAGLVGDDGKGNLTSMAVTYDGAAKDSVTLGGAGATTPVALKNVADGKDRHDAINLGQLQDAGLVGQDGSGNLTSLAVAYDGAAKDTVTLKGADGTTITNVKAGAVTATSTDAINGAQLHGTAQSVADSLGGGATVGADGTVTNPTYSLADPADASQSKSYNNVGDALSNLDGRTTTNTQNITVINKQLADSGLVDPVTGQSIAAVTYDRNADGTPNLGSVTLGGAGATTPVALKNVADGVDRHDAINVGQLQDAGLVAPIDSSNPGTGLTSLAVTYDKHADGSANFDQITLKGANGTTLSNVKAGAVNATSMDAVNGSQLYGASKSVADALGGGATVDANGNVTNPTYTVNDKTYNNVGDAIENISSSLVHGSIGLVQQDADTREITVAKDTDGTSVNFTGTAGDRVLTGVGAGAVSATSRDAINGAQLHGTAQSVADVIGGGTTVDADGKLADTSIEVNGSKYKTVAEAVQAAAKYGATDSLAVRYDLNKDGTPNYGSVTLGGSGAAPVRLTNVADGSSRYDAVNFGQLSELNDKIGGLDDRVGELERNPGTGNPGNGGSGNDYFAGTDVGTDGTTKANAGGGTGNTAAGSGATIGTGANNATVVGSNANVSGSNGTAIGSGSKSSAEGATAIGSNAKASGEKSTAIGDGANASGKNSVALGAGSVASSDNTVSVGTADQKRTISNLADGVNASDAATKGQMDRAIGGVQGQVNDLSRNAYSGIAAATALTMIPGVDPGKTVSFGIGGATYKGYQAVAFGGEALITQNLKMKAGVGMSSGGNTVGVGASYQW
ncbi:YadA-like family protein [Burkholderia cenocepacia]|uniref:YadA-like family protein n=1 Tax=Burkholderia cenocepacia TaxID=95486 RepID=UPI001B99A1C9|nr:YadA-like family protein [Burkholderia cenocepacia]MBR8264665.1 YadA-like family protein [Burkholderia cenocepacia]